MFVIFGYKKIVVVAMCMYVVVGFETARLSFGQIVLLHTNYRLITNVRTIRFHLRWWWYSRRFVILETSCLMLLLLLLLFWHNDDNKVELTNRKSIIVPSALLYWSLSIVVPTVFVNIWHHNDESNEQKIQAIKVKTKKNIIIKATIPNFFVFHVWPVNELPFHHW
jgi:hypothetical protein